MWTSRKSVRMKVEIAILQMYLNHPARSDPLSSQWASLAIMVHLSISGTLASKLRLFALVLTLARLTTPFPINVTEDLLLPSFLGDTRPCCADLQSFPKWYQPSKKFDNGDCTKAINIFNTEYVENHDGARYEFYNTQGQPIHGIPTQRVPLKFSYGKSCAELCKRYRG